MQPRHAFLSATPSRLSLDVPRIFGDALALHRMGELSQAEQLYRKVIRAQTRSC